MQPCSHHPLRPAFAVCMACRKSLCQECATQWDGIWHCATCLASKRTAVKARSPVAGWIVLAASSLFLLFLSARMMVWVGALMSGVL